MAPDIRSRSLELKFLAPVLAGLIFAGVFWRSVWLASGLQGTNSDSDRVRHQLSLAEQQLPLKGYDIEWAVTDSFNRSGRSNIESAQGLFDALPLREYRIDRWEPETPVWLSAGSDGQPGWANRDDNLDGVVDDGGELGAAWSDDVCLTDLPADDGNHPSSFRQIGSGAFAHHEGGLSDLPPNTKRLRITVSSQRL